MFDGLSRDQKNFEMVAGDTQVIAVPVTDENGDPFNLSSCSVAWAMAKSAKSPALVSKTLTDGIEVTNIVGGLIEVTLSPADTIDLTPDRYYYEMKLLDSDQHVFTLLTGFVKLEPALIRAVIVV